MNRQGKPDHDPGLQRHHLLPRAVLSRGCLTRMWAALGTERYVLGDFRQNGLLLPCQERAAIRLGLPLHRGPHRRYSEMVFERIGQIEAGWARAAPKDALSAALQARMRLDLLRRALRRYLLDPRRARFRLSRHEPLGAQVDFTELDAMADALWSVVALPPEP